MKYLNEILFLLGESKKKLPFALLLFILVAVFDLLGLWVIAPFIILVTNEEIFFNTYNLSFIKQYIINLDFLIIYMGLFLLLVFLSRSLITIFIKYIILKFTLNLRVKFQKSLLEKYQKMSYLDYTERNSSSYIETVSNLVPRFTTNINAILNILSDTVIVSAIFIFLSFQNIEMLVVTLFFVIVFILLYDLLFKKKLKQYGQYTSEGSKTLLQSLLENMTGFKEIKILAVDNFFINKFMKGANQVANNLTKSSLISISPRYFFEFLLILILVLFVFIFETTSQPRSEFIAHLSIFGLASLRIIPLANQFATNLTAIRLGRFPTAQIYSDYKLININSNIDLKITHQHSSFQKLELKNLTFKYPTREVLAFNSISLSILKGQMVGIVGSSGSGKTSLIDNITGLLEPTSGKIEYNGKNLNDHLHQWRSQIAYIPQQPLIIDDTIKNNICLGKFIQGSDELKINEVLKESQLYDFIKKLPEGINTKIGDKGSKISGGQKQRIVLARAFYHEREILILDESLNSLDKQTEHSILEQLNILKGKKTIILISHQKSSLKYCDQIYNLDI